MKDLKIYIIIATSLFAIYIIANLNRPKEVDWTYTYSDTDKIPFGTRIIYERANDIFPASIISSRRRPVFNVIADDSLKGSSYIIICGGVNISKNDYEQLKKYITAGNDVFIASNFLGTLAEKELKLSINLKFSLNAHDSPVSFCSPFLNQSKTYWVDKGATSNYFEKFDTARVVVMGQNAEHKANFIKYAIGKGNLYLTPNPGMFTNYSLLKPQGAAYAATALSLVKKTTVIVWDEYYTQGSGEEESPMRVFLNNRQLRWAYYIALFSLLIFVLFEIKRRQRIIPVIKPLDNSTVDFVNVVGQVYYESRDNTNIARKKTTYFLAYLRDKYKIKTEKFNNEFTELLAQKTGIDSTLATNLTTAFIFVNTHNQVTDRELIKLNHLIEQFYIQSR